jgi:alcohol dehydrogenase class IV
VRFEFATADRILFGPGSVKEVAPAAANLGQRAMLVASRSSRELLSGRLEACSTYIVSGEPTIDVVRWGTAAAREGACDAIIAIGGGSVIDAGKAIAALLTNPGDPLDYLEVIGRGQPIERDPAPFVAVPTTAGTGAEVTRNAVLGSPEQRVKASLRSVRMLPALAVIDPELTIGLPPAITASTGLDALTQLIEPYVSIRANPMTDLFCQEGMRAVAMSLRAAYHNGRNYAAREGMSWAALLGGMALANAGLGAVHGFAAPIGGMFPAPHGAICAALLPHAMTINIEALRTRAPQNQALERYRQVAWMLTGHPQSSPENGASWVAELCRELEISPLRAYGIEAADIPVLVEKGARASSMKGNPIVLNETELREIVTRAL